MDDPMLVVCPHCLARNRVPPSRLADAPSCGCCKQRLFASQPVALDAASFEVFVRRGDLPVLVDFWAPWCAPCLAMAPQFAAAAAHLEPGMRLAKVDTEAEPAIAAAHGVRSIPTLILFHHGRELDRRAGATTTDDIVRWARGLLGDPPAAAPRP